MDPSILRVRISSGFDDVAHGVLHVCRSGSRTGIQSNKSIENDQERVHAKSDAHRILLRRILVAIKFGIFTFERVVYTNDKGADARVGLRRRDLLSN